MAVIGVTAASGPSVSVVFDGVADRQLHAEAATSSTLANVSQSVTSGTVLAANTSTLRQGAAIYNDATAVLYLSLSTSATSVSAHTVQVPPAGLYELQRGWQGAVTGMWAAAGSGFARVTELAF